MTRSTERRRPGRARGALHRWCRAIPVALLVVVLATVVSLAVWTQTPGFRDGMRSLAERVLTARLGEQVTLQDVRIDLWPPALEARRLAITRADGRPIVSVDQLRAPLVLGRGGPMIGRLLIERPIVQLGLDADGKLDAFRQLELPEPDPDAPILKRLPLRSVALRDGALSLRTPDGTIELWDLAISPTLEPWSELSAGIAFTVGGMAERGTLRATRLQIGPDRVGVDDLAIELPSLSGIVTANAPLGEQAQLTATLAADLDGLSAALPPPKAARGLLQLDVALGGLPGAPRAEAAVRIDDLSFDLPGALTPVITYNLGEIRAAVIAVGDRLRVDDLRLAYGGGVVRFTGELSRALELTGTVSADDVSLEQALVMAGAAPTPWVDMRADAEVSIAGSLNPLHLVGPFELDVAELRVGDRPISAPGVEVQLDLPVGSAAGELELFKDRITLAAETVRAPRSQGRADVEIGFGPYGPLDVRVDLVSADLEDIQPLGGSALRGRGRLAGRVRGPFKQLRFDGWGDIDGLEVTGIPYADHITATITSPDMRTLEITDAEATRGQTDYSGEVRLDFRGGLALSTRIVVPDGHIEDMTSMFVDLEGLTGRMSGTLWLDGPLYDMDGEAHLSARDVDLYGLRFRDGEAHGYMDRGLFTLDALELRKAGGGATLRGSVGRGYALDMELAADGVSLGDLDWLEGLDQSLDGDVTLLAHIGNVLQEPEPDGRLDVTDMRYANHPVDDSAVLFDTEDGTMALTGLLVGGTVTADASLGLWDEQPYDVKARFESFPAHVFYPVAADGKPVTATVSGALSLAGNLGDEPSPTDLKTTLDDVEVRWAGHTLRNRTPWRYNQRGAHFEIDNVDLEGAGSSLQIEARGGPQSLTVDGHGDLDLDLLRAVVPGLTRAEGRAEVSLEVAGRAPELHAAVDVTVDGSLVRHSAFPGTFEDLRGVVHATSSGYDVDATASVGGGAVDVTGTISAVDWMPERFDLDAVARNAQVQWVDYLPPAIGDARLRFDGPVDALLLSGDIDITEATFSDRIDWEDWVVEWRDVLLVDYAGADAEPYFSMDVALRGPHTIRLRNNVADGVASADLRIIGDTSRPGILGQVVIDDGELYLQDREFLVERGVIDFRDPWTWDPELDFDLQTEIQSREQRYQVSYAVRGPFSDWRTSTHSDPALPQADINALLWFGVTADDLEGMGELSQAIAQGVADLILADLFVSTQVGDLREELPFFVERIEVVTGVNARGEYSSEPRLLVDARFREIGDLHLTSELNFVRSDDQYLRLDRRLSDTWSLSAWYATKQRDRQLQIGGAYGIDLRARWETEP